MNIGLVLGFFDGVHKAHRVVIESVVNSCDTIYILTFKDSPALYFNHKAEYILQRKDSAEKIRNLMYKFPDKTFQVIEQEFSSLANTSAQDYLENIIDTYHPKIIGTGFNHTFGLNKSGTPEFLKSNENKYGYKYICTNPIYEGNDVISSTLIRELLRKGKIEKANELLESNFILEGIVVHGAKLGRTIGFPTANISYPEVLTKIPFGVYKGLIELSNEKEKKNAIINWGMKPTFNNTAVPVIEAHIIDFNRDIYGNNIRIEVLKQIRSEKKFDSSKELAEQIKKDIEECLK